MLNPIQSVRSDLTSCLIGWTGLPMILRTVAPPVACMFKFAVLSEQ